MIESAHDDREPLVPLVDREPLVIIADGQADGPPGSWRFRVRGELDMTTAASLERAVRDVLRTGVTHVALDIGGLQFVDSSGLRCLMALQIEAGASGVGLALENPSHAMHRLLQLTGLETLLEADVAGD